MKSKKIQITFKDQATSAENEPFFLRNFPVFPLAVGHVYSKTTRSVAITTWFIR